MAENLSRQKLWVIEANVFIVRRGISGQSFMTMGKTGHEMPVQSLYVQSVAVALPLAKWGYNCLYQ